MITTPPTAPEATPPPATPSDRPGHSWIAVAAVASLGAGGIHAVAVGVHSDPRAVALTFTAVAAVQLAWAATALARPLSRLVLAAGLALHVAAVGGWLLAKTVGIGFIEGLDASESIQFADGAAAALAAVAGVLTARALLLPSPSSEQAAAPAPARRPGLRLAALSVPVAALTVAAMVSAGSHSHAGGHDETAAGDHGHGGGEHTEDMDHAAADHPDGDHADGEHATALPAKAYDPNLPIDLSGVDGVTPEQQARAENLIAITLIRLPQFADPATAEAEGFRSIGDGFTGHEHYINWDYINDEHVLNPDYPESLVYDTTGPEKRLVSAMFMTKQGVSLDDVPELGGALTQWHVHDDLCFTQGDAPLVRGITEVGGECQPPLQKFDPTPMIHVWIEPHRCGPFAALEGVGAGQVKEGEEHLCNHAHGA